MGLVNRPNFILTPHIAWSSHEAAAGTGRPGDREHRELPAGTGEQECRRKQPDPGPELRAALVRLGLLRPGAARVSRPDRRRLVGYLARRPARRSRLRQAGAGQAARRRRLARAGRAQPLRGRLAAIAARAVPGRCRALLGQDPEPARSPWTICRRSTTRCGRRSFAQGDADPAVAARSRRGSRRIHAATAAIRVEAAFATDRIFYAIRLEPYLVATARAHPDLGARLNALVERHGRRPSARWCMATSARRTSWSGPHGPVFLDAECAWYGDPAFDLAFCLNHLLLKCLWRRPAAARTSSPASTRWPTAYLAAVTWEPPAATRGARRGAAARPVPRPRRRQVAGRVRHRATRTRSACGASPRR